METVIFVLALLFFDSFIWALMRTSSTFATICAHLVIFLLSAVGAQEFTNFIMPYIG